MNISFKKSDSGTERMSAALTAPSLFVSGRPASILSAVFVGVLLLLCVQVHSAYADCTPSVGTISSVETNSSQTSYTLSNFTVGSSGNDQILVVTAATEDDTITAASATFNSEDMTIAGSEAIGTNASAVLLYLVNPPVTTADVVVTFDSSPSIRAGVSAVVLDCVDTATAPITDVNTATGNISGSINVVTANTLIIDALGNEDEVSNPATTETGQTAVLNEALGSGSSWGVSWKLETGTGSSAMGWSNMSGSSGQVIAGFAPQSASSPDAPTDLTTTSNTGSVGLSWTAPADPGDSPLETYGIFRSTSPFAETSTTTFLTSIATTSTSYSDTSAIHGTVYYYAVTATNQTATSSLSNQRSSGSNNARIIRLKGLRLQ